MTTFYTNYVSLCAKAGKSLSGAAEAIGLSRTSPNGWKNGKMPSDVTLAKLAQYFNVSIDDLLKPADEEKTRSPITSKIDAILYFNRIAKTDLLKACNISGDSYAKWDSGETMPTVEELARIAGYLHVTLGYLLEPEEEQKKETSARAVSEVLETFIDLFSRLSMEQQVREIAYLKSLVDDPNK